MVIVSATSSEHGSSIIRASDSEGKTSDVSTAAPAKKCLKFWLTFASMCICLFLAALEVTSIPTALPTIAHDLHASQFVWVGSAYALSSTAVLPMSGSLAQAFGRRPATLITLGLFALGSGICGSANSMNMLIAGRTIQGLGGGGIQCLATIILSDLVSLQERGVYAGFFGLTWCLAAAVGPVVGGSLAAQGQWRWLFYLNLPISFLGSLAVIFLLDLPTPPGNYRDKFGRLDWIGNFLIIASTVAYTIGLTWGGTTAPWGSPTVLIPLVLGSLGLVVFKVYEATMATHPLVPLELMTNVTIVSGYVQSFCISLVTMTIVYFFPVYFQACRGASPTLSGIYTLTLCAFAPSSFVAGLSVKVTGRYRPPMWIGWAMMIVAMGLLSSPTTNAIDMGIGTSLGCLVLLGLASGMLNATIIYPIQAPLSETQNAPALAWMWFLRSFASVWGVTIGSAVLQNELAKTLPASFIQTLPRSTTEVNDLYALIPEFSSLAPHVRTEVQVGFFQSLVVLWQVSAAVCAVGGVASLFMRGITLRRTLDETWAMKCGEKELDLEVATVGNVKVGVSVQAHVAMTIAS